jgi:hypothetical protein
MRSDKRDKQLLKQLSLGLDGPLPISEKEMISALLSGNRLEMAERDTRPNRYLHAYLLMKRLSPSKHCRFCSEPLTEETFDVATSYWWAFQHPCHKGCREKGQAKEAYECQKLDRDCNDCGYFQRTENGRWVCHGICLKTGQPAKAYPNNASLNPCFVHRKDAQVSNPLMASKDTSLVNL